MLYRGLQLAQDGCCGVMAELGGELGPLLANLRKVSKG